MAVLQPRYSHEEFALRGQAIYERDIRPHLDPGDDGKLFAYSLSDGGSDWRTIKVRDVQSGKDRDDEVQWAKFTNISFNHAGTGFYYSRYLVFSESNLRGRVQLVRYFSMVLACIALNYMFLKFFIEYS